MLRAWIVQAQGGQVSLGWGRRSDRESVGLLTTTRGVVLTATFLVAGLFRRQTLDDRHVANLRAQTEI